jgi:outer membrane protein W
VAGQVGFDYMLNNNWGLNFDVKRIMMRPSASGVVYNSFLNTFIPVHTKVKIDPWLVSAGITYRFGGGASAPVVAKY